MNAGDVSWSPRFAFRSRFFAIYILARGIVNMKTATDPLYGATRRMEVVYDALRDEVIWRRQQATEKRALGDPEP